MIVRFTIVHSLFSSGSTAREMLREPTGVVCFDGRLFVADSRNHRVQVCVAMLWTS
jgi:hypothetical protein